ncbi:hypothetical protein GOBAR_DD06451 [Gossypium barbadense]|nr:hypothetical protein GOBAR_DD06451 [Gossypium barbadense]
MHKYEKDSKAKLAAPGKREKRTVRIKKSVRKGEHKVEIRLSEKRRMHKYEKDSKAKLAAPGKREKRTVRIKKSVRKGEHKVEIRLSEKRRCVQQQKLKKKERNYAKVPNLGE